MTVTAPGKNTRDLPFFAFPDGTGVLYTLQGAADPPVAGDTLVHELPAKTLHTLLLPVHNWLSRQQRFLVCLETVKPDKPDATVSLKEIKFIDVPAHAKRDYECFVLFCFLHTQRATSPGVLSTIKLGTPVRQVASATIQVENPLTQTACLTKECKCLGIIVQPQHSVPGQSKVFLTVHYMPLHPGESTARLTLFSNELGHFHYDLLLRALPPPPEKSVDNTLLGSSHSVTVMFNNYSRFKTEYCCKTDRPAFIVDKNVSTLPGFPSGSKASMEVRFKPYQLG
ncbi:hydrocephalus-inducing protein [Oreochromis niloticus]|uniref:hydrocephalus-inducing protein n=1 Tax=Oreochromis niloticus TaxID=8128 RepID=UPI000905CF77|nr:hydrocephalus-inducing protein [Oreochromis niloticus]XP_025764858.1 hydrocephalus-inducing protein [Oreochromis niloticus]XP_025764859.1 hydrocephalus-inducing protein [Oreochromis niloticus]